MRKKKQYSALRRRFSLTNLTLIVLFMSLFSYMQFEFMDDIFLLAAKNSMIVSSREIAELNYKSDTFKSELSDIEANNSLYVEIYSPRDRLIYTTDSNKTVYEEAHTDSTESEIKLSPRVMKLISQETYPDGSYFEIRQEFFTTAQYLVYGTFYGTDMGIEVYYSTDLIRDNAETASWVLLALSITILVSVLIVISLIAKMYIDPIQIIKSTTQKMAALDFNEVCPHFRNKEIDELSDNINFLSSSLSKSLKELKSENRKLESDIEQERKQEKARRSFVANASHELKTPISIIQGLLCGLWSSCSTAQLPTILTKAAFQSSAL